MTPSGRTAAFATLGCKLNQYETDSIATQLVNRGYRLVPFDAPADVYVINSCTVTNRADRKSRNLWNRSTRNEGITVLTGCFVDSHRDELESDAKTYIVPNSEKQSIPELIEGHFAGEIVHPVGSVFDFPNADRLFHTRSNIKVQDGCDNHCTFCIIPAVRGRAQSRPAADVVEAVRLAVDDGAREIVLTGVNMSRYQNEGVSFTGLVRRCLEARDAEYRVRISSLEPERLSDEFVELFAHPRMAPHLHLCLQSGSPRVLLAMRRQYTLDTYATLVEKLRGLNPLFNITTDLIAGFPGETEEDFLQSLDAITRFSFGHVHTFPYSVRRGTRAERMESQVHSGVRTERARRIRAASEAAKRHYRSRHLLETTGSASVLIEKVRQDAGDLIAEGLTGYYVPVQMRVPNDQGADALVNRLVQVELTGLQSGDDPSLEGTIKNR